MSAIAASLPDRDAPLLSLRRFGIAYGERRILEAIDLDIPPRSVTVMMGPAGTGKSTLLRTLCCEQAPADSVRLSGEAKFRGRILDADNCPALVARQLDGGSSVHDYLAAGLPNRDELRRDEQRQHFAAALRRAGLPHLVATFESRLADLAPVDRKCLSLIRTLGDDPPLICLDEPTAGLEEATPLLAIIDKERCRRTFLVVTHHQGAARAIANDVVLLAGGRIVEQGPAESFFASPQNQTSVHFLKTGGCHLPSLDARPEHLAPECRSWPELPVLSRAAPPDEEGPPGFRWLIPGRLGGACQPGLFGDLERDLKALRRVGATMLVGLTERPMSPGDVIERLGLGHCWLPIDMIGVPDLATAAGLCAAMERKMESGGTVVYHCLAGHGANLMLVAHLIYRGMTASQALAHAQRRGCAWVPSLSQEQFLWDLEFYLAMHGTQRVGNGHKLT
jgi:atypical dual specificity phosphatase